jgi:hypothetical protein
MATFSKILKSASSINPQYGYALAAVTMAFGLALFLVCLDPYLTLSGRMFLFLLQLNFCAIVGAVGAVLVGYPLVWLLDWQGWPPRRGRLTIWVAAVCLPLTLAFFALLQSLYRGLFSSPIVDSVPLLLPSRGYPPDYYLQPLTMLWVNGCIVLLGTLLLVCALYGLFELFGLFAARRAESNRIEKLLCDPKSVVVNYPGGSGRHLTGRRRSLNFFVLDTTKASNTSSYLLDLTVLHHLFIRCVDQLGIKRRKVPILIVSESDETRLCGPYCSWNPKWGHVIVLPTNLTDYLQRLLRAERAHFVMNRASLWETFQEKRCIAKGLTAVLHEVAHCVTGHRRLDLLVRLTWALLPLSSIVLFLCRVYRRLEVAREFACDAEAIRHAAIEPRFIRAAIDCMSMSIVNFKKVLLYKKIAELGFAQMVGRLKDRFDLLARMAPRLSRGYRGVAALPVCVSGLVLATIAVALVPNISAKLDQRFLPGLALALENIARLPELPALTHRDPLNDSLERPLNSRPKPLNNQPKPLNNQPKQAPNRPVMVEGDRPQMPVDRPQGLESAQSHEGPDTKSQLDQQNLRNQLAADENRRIQDSANQDFLSQQSAQRIQQDQNREAQQRVLENQWQSQDRLAREQQSFVQLQRWQQNMVLQYQLQEGLNQSGRVQQQLAQVEKTAQDSSKANDRTFQLAKSLSRIARGTPRTSTANPPASIPTYQAPRTPAYIPPPSIPTYQPPRTPAYIPPPSILTYQPPRTPAYIPPPSIPTYQPPRTPAYIPLPSIPTYQPPRTPTYTPPPPQPSTRR